MIASCRTAEVRQNRSVSGLLAAFFILSFIDATIKTNLYLGAPMLLLLLITLGRFPFSLAFSLLSLTVAAGTVLFLPPSDTARAVKTLLIGAVIPFCVTHYKHNESELIKGYLTGTAFFILVEALYFLATGRTFISATPIMLGWPRFQAFFSDSNFFCHAMVAYIIYVKLKTGKNKPLLTSAVIASLSFSAIACLLAFYVYNPLLARSTRQTVIRRILGVSTLIIFFFYFLLIFLAGDIRNLASGDVAAFKLVSLAIRFDMQNAALTEFWNSGHFLFGLGAGAAKDLTEYGLNLHNTYLQILVESGASVFAYVTFCILFMYRKINLRMLPHFSICIITGNILEVYYFPLLFFVFYLSKLLDQASDQAIGNRTAVLAA